jgi:hypothetical protein
MKSIFFIFICLFLSGPLFAQEVGFMGINIGMTRDDVLGYADGREIIEVPKNRDVEFFPVEEREILTLSINPEVPHIYLQFYNEKLYAITVIFNEKYIDYMTLSSRLTEKYGPYNELTPQWRKWDIGEVEVKVEKPAVVKYIALKEFLEVTDFKAQNELGESEKKQILLDGL